MQIFKITSLSADRPQNGTLESNGETSPTGAELAQNAQDYAALIEGETGESTPSVGTFDLLFGGAPTAPGTTPQAGQPSANDFAPVGVAKADEILAKNPYMLYSPNALQRIIEAYDTVLQTKYAPRLENLEKSLANTELAPQEAMVIKGMIDQIKATIDLIKTEKGTVEEKRVKLLAVIAEEKGTGTDKDLNGIIGNIDEDDARVLVHYPNGEDVWVNKISRQPVFESTISKNYTPQLFKTNDMDRVTGGTGDNAPAVRERQKGFDEAFRLNLDSLYSGDRTTTFGAGIDLPLSEGYWVEAENGAPKVKTEQDGTEEHFIPKPFTEKDGKYLQEAPSENEKDRWIFVRTTKLEVKSEDIGKIDGKKVDGGDVYFTFRDREDNVVMRIRVEGASYSESRNAHVFFMTSEKGDGENSNIVAATSVPVGIFSPKEADGSYSKEFSRINPIDIDASLFEGTGQAIINEDRFYQDAGIDKTEFREYLNNLNKNDGTWQRARRAAVDAIETFTQNHRLVTGWGNDTYGVKNYAYLPKYGYRGDPGEEVPPEEKHGVFVKLPPGSNFKGGKNTDIVVTTSIYEANLKELLFGDKEVPEDSLLLGSTVDAGGGKNVVINHERHAFVSGADFFWNDSHVDPRADEGRIFLQMKNSTTKNFKNFVRFVNDPKEAFIDNGMDVDLSPGGDGNTKDAMAFHDDFYGVNTTMTKFTKLQTDLPGAHVETYTANDIENNDDLEAKGIVPGDMKDQPTIDDEVVSANSDDIASAIKKEAEARIAAFKLDPTVLPPGGEGEPFEIPQWIKDDLVPNDHFFSDFAFFHPEEANGVDGSAVDPVIAGDEKDFLAEGKK